MSWRFARRPSWVIRHLLVLALLVAMVNFGFWQLRRLDDRREHNAAIRAMQEAPTVEVTEVVPAGSSVGDPELDRLLYRSVIASGAYDDDSTVVVANRSFNGAPGGWVLTPLVMADGTGLIVNRGFLGFDRQGRLLPPPAPEGQVRVQGLLQASEERGRFGPADAAVGEDGLMARADLERIGRKVPYALLPVLVQLASSDPPERPAGATAGVFARLRAPELSEGPHLSYAAQWFIFSLIALVGYPLILRRVALQEGRERRASACSGPDGAPPPAPDELDLELQELLRSER